MKVKTKCPNCGGSGTLPPLGDQGNQLDIKRFFPRPCDTCHCSRFVYIEKVIEESANGSQVSGYTAGQGDC